MGACSVKGGPKVVGIGKLCICMRGGDGLGVVEFVVDDASGVASSSSSSSSPSSPSSPS